MAFSDHLLRLRAFLSSYFSSSFVVCFEQINKQLSGVLFKALSCLLVFCAGHVNSFLKDEKIEAMAVIAAYAWLGSLVFAVADAMIRWKIRNFIFLGICAQTSMVVCLASLVYVLFGFAGFGFVVGVILLSGFSLYIHTLEATGETIPNPVVDEHSARGRVQSPLEHRIAIKSSDEANKRKTSMASEGINKPKSG